MSFVRCATRSATLPVVIAAIAAPAALGALGAVGAVAASTPLVMSGDPVPFAGATGGFAGFQIDAVIGQGGHAAFSTGWEGARGAQVVKRLGEPPVLIAELLAQAPGLPAGVKLDTLLPMRVNGDGTAAFYARLSGPGVFNTNGEAMFRAAPGGPLTLVARQGDQVPGAPDGVWFAGQTSRVLNDAGQLVFGNMPLISAPAGGGPIPVVFAKEPFPGSPGVTVSFVESRRALNASGTLAYTARLSGGDIPSDGALLVRSAAGATTTVVARRGQPAPGTDAYYASIGVPSINRAGQVGFYASLGDASGAQLPGTVNAVFVGAPGSVTAVARTGDVAPGTDGQLVFREPNLGGEVYVGGDNHIVFGGRLKNAQTQAAAPDGLFVGAPDSVRLVARGGTPAPDTAPGVTFGGFHDFAINASNTVAFVSYLLGTGASSESDAEAVYACGPDGTLLLVARERAPFQVAPGDTRVVKDIGFNGRAGSQDGSGIGLNDAGQLLFSARFTDGTSGLFIASAFAPGDASNDGRVDFTDLVALAQNYNAPAGKKWAQGDFTGDGDVDFADLVVLAQHYNNNPFGAAGAPVPAPLAADWPAALAAVPEPGAGLLLAIATGATLTRRRRRR